MHTTISRRLRWRLELLALVLTSTGENAILCDDGEQTPPHFLPTTSIYTTTTNTVMHEKRNTSINFAYKGGNAWESFISQLCVCKTCIHFDTRLISFIHRCVKCSVIAASTSVNYARANHVIVIRAFNWREEDYCLEYATNNMVNIIHPLLHSSNMHNTQLESIVSTDTYNPAQGKLEEYNNMLFYYFNAVVHLNK